MLYGSIEAGGTKFVCAVGDENFKIVDIKPISTTTPEKTFEKVVEYFKKFSIGALGIASFGPIDLNKSSETYGYITTTPKKGWSNVDFLGKMGVLGVPMSWTTDVNGSAYGEMIALKNNDKNLSSLVYYTVGTGVGAGIVYNDKFVGDLGNPELGHIFLKRHPDDLDFEGICPYHKDCLEGLASGPTFDARLGIPGKDVPYTNHVWDIIAYYVAQAIMQVTLTFRPEKVILGGGVANNAKFIEKVRDEFSNLINDYVNYPNLEGYIVQPVVENNGSATLGNFALAKNLI